MSANHRWTTTSSHATSEGPVRYQRCACGAHRVLYPSWAVPAAATTAVRPR